MGKNLSRPFTAENITSQKGKVFLVTGANTGLGLETCKVLASKGATVVMTVRDQEKSAKAIETVKKVAESNEGNVESITMDLADLASVKKAAEDFIGLNLPLHCLINNAGVMMCPKGFTKDGFERQFGTNHLGHFAFTAQLFPALKATAATDGITEHNPVRIVNLSSSYHSKGPKAGILFDNLKWEAETLKYNPGLAYGHSKFANVVFTKELQDRLAASGEKKIISTAVHPGFVDTELTRHVERKYSKTIIRFFKWWNGALSVQDGALTQLYCAVSPEIVQKNYQGEYFVPIAQRSDLDKSAPKVTKEMQQKLWDVSQELTGVQFGI